MRERQRLHPGRLQSWVIWFVRGTLSRMRALAKIISQVLAESKMGPSIAKAISHRR
jgi:hypothetical protein